MRRLAPAILPLAALALACPPRTRAPRTSGSAPASAPGASPVHELAGGACSAPQPDAALIADLKAKGVKAIINLRPPEEFDPAPEIAAARAAGLRYFNIPVVGSDPRDAQLEEFLRLVSDPANRPFFFHCHSGNRAGAFWIAKRMLQDGWSEDRAVAEAESIGLRSASLKAFALDYVKRRRRAWRARAGTLRLNAR